MVFKRILVLPALFAVCWLIFGAGCAGPGGGEPVGIDTEPDEPTATGPIPAPVETVTLALKFTVGQTADYRVTIEETRGIAFQGKMASEGALKGGKTGNRIQMDFTERIESVDETGNAVAKITLKALKYLSQEKDVVRLDFDSSQQNDDKDPLGKLIGQSYTIEITGSGKAVRVVDAADAQRAVMGRTPAHKRASALLRPAVIMARHSIAAIPGEDKNRVSTGGDWSNVKTVDFTMMGKKSYERIYQLKQIESSDGRRVAVVEMNAIPTTETEDRRPSPAETGLSEMFDNLDTYSGELRLDLASGRVEKYSEELRSEWFMVDPQAQQTDKEPDSMTMTAIRVHSLERID
jgi:hypothetical protein